MVIEELVGNQAVSGNWTKMKNLKCQEYSHMQGIFTFGRIVGFRMTLGEKPLVHSQLAVFYI